MTYTPEARAELRKRALPGTPEGVTKWLHDHLPPYDGDGFGFTVTTVNRYGTLPAVYLKVQPIGMIACMAHGDTEDDARARLIVRMHDALTAHDISPSPDAPDREDEERPWRWITCPQCGDEYRTNLKNLSDEYCLTCNTTPGPEDVDTERTAADPDGDNVYRDTAMPDPDRPVTFRELEAMTMKAAGSGHRRDAAMHRLSEVTRQLSGLDRDLTPVRLMSVEEAARRLAEDDWTYTPPGPDDAIIRTQDDDDDELSWDTPAENPSCTSDTPIQGDAKLRSITLTVYLDDGPD